MSVRIAFDFDAPERRHEAKAVCHDVFDHQVVTPDAAEVVVVGESAKCDPYLKEKKAVVYWPRDARDAHVTVLGRNAPADGRRLFVVGSTKAPGFLDAMAQAIVAIE